MESSTSIPEQTDAQIHLNFRGGLRYISTHGQRRLFILSLIVADTLTLVATFMLAYWARFNLPVFSGGPDLRTSFYAEVSLVVIPGWLLIFWAHRLYDWRFLLGGMREYASVFQSCLICFVSIAVAEFFVEDLVIARGWLALVWILSVILIGVERFLMRRAAYGLRHQGLLTSPALILGANQEGRALGEQILSWPTSGLQVLGYLDDQQEVGSRIYKGLHVVGSLARLDELVRKYHVEELVIASSAISRQSLLEVFERYSTQPDIQLRLSSGLFEVITTGLDVKEIAYIPLIGVNRARLTGADLVIKTVVDYTVAVSALLLLSPMMLLIGLAVKMSSSGPIFYRRRVMGLNGTQFYALKFRTMHINGDEILQASPALLDELATTHKIKDDPRITPIGQFLRKYSLDELPQLFNILRGEMSLVGPRMISPPELRNYGQWAMNLLTVRPGITGLWQVSGRSDVSYDERVRLDMFYIRNFSIWLDLHLILRTIPVVLSGKGAY